MAARPGYSAESVSCRAMGGYSNKKYIYILYIYFFSGKILLVYFSPGPRQDKDSPPRDRGIIRFSCKNIHLCVELSNRSNTEPEPDYIYS